MLLKALLAKAQPPPKLTRSACCCCWESNKLRRPRSREGASSKLQLQDGTDAGLASPRRIAPSNRAAHLPRGEGTLEERPSSCQVGADVPSRSEGRGMLAVSARQGRRAAPAARTENKTARNEPLQQYPPSPPARGWRSRPRKNGENARERNARENETAQPHDRSLRRRRSEAVNFAEFCLLQRKRETHKKNSLSSTKLSLRPPTAGRTGGNGRREESPMPWRTTWSSSRRST